MNRRHAAGKYTCSHPDANYKMHTALGKMNAWGGEAFRNFSFLPLREHIC